ncbi:Smr/MutS family protein [Methylomonas koyamae]|uniref:DNA mismatch repair protein MutS n=1 Tax=Methylomonas koyamae TaxID=702114 RepID=A0A177PEG7_9GAMM|nr:Smr/MutS family protein [Methylomonas koyamae]ATG91757.1 DNA mismatch repair protein MutS [Methylomonas koyamae]OAI19388.1 DNA mismatch repair protein MutS [Methylomonas koyamae]OAI27809.1 DNA mismatch repair protein MutS [Methylomonas koyamae]WNB75197.1 Smr/MutS family protein [Methylomonas koyamae]
MTKKTTSPDDSALFRNTVGQVKAIDTNTVNLQPAGKPRPFPKSKPLEQVDPLRNDIAGELDTLFQEDRIAFLAPGLQKSVLKKLRKGQYGLDAEIDLHGLTSRAAKQRLLNFLHDCVENGIRCAHIIHGKGYNSPDNQPVLKNDINLWLRQHQDVLAFCSAPPKSGGSGAVFVLLRLSDKFGFSDSDL